MKNRVVYVIITILLVLLIVVLFFYFNQEGRLKNSDINNFEKCAKANGGFVQETYPRRCVTPDGRTFTEESIIQEKEKSIP